MYFNIKYFLTNNKIKQVFILYTSTIIQAFFGFLVSVMLARKLGPEQYGNYSYLFNLFSFFLLLINTGHFLSTSMLLAKSSNLNYEKELIGASLLIAVIISILFCTVAFGFSYIQDYLFNEKIGKSIRYLSFALIFFPLQIFLENIFIGLNKITSLATLRVGPKIIFSIFLLISFYSDNLTYYTAFVLMLMSSYLVYCIQIISIKPKFTNLKSMIGLLRSENRQYGMHVYWGSIFGVASTYLVTLSISYFQNNMDLGYYNIAVAVSTPLIFLPSSVASSYFKEFSRLHKVPIKIILSSITVSLVSLLIFILFLEPAISILYSDDYKKSVPIGYILGLAMIIHGYGDIYNRFLCAKAKGKEVRNGAIFAGFINILSFFIFVPNLGGLGAACCRLSVSFAYLFAMYFLYHKTTVLITNSYSKN